jgi:EAL and modified HD-GYP domain-containing signal transduction protein
MFDHPVLGQLALGYSPIIDRQRAVIATRLTLFPERPDATIDVAALMVALQEVWPAQVPADELKLTLRPLQPREPGVRGGSVAAAPAITPVALNFAGEALLDAVMKAAPLPHLMLEVPAFMATDAAHAAALQQLRAAGAVLLIKGRPLVPVAPEVLACFSHALVDAAEDRRSAAPPSAGVRQVSTVQAGVRSTAEAEAAFQRGVVAVLGWPFNDPLPAAAARSKVATDIQVVMELIQGVDREEPVNRLEAVLKRDPTLAFRLLRYLNSPAFGLSAEVTSFGHAIMMLGYGRLKRWLALLLASSSKGANARPLMHAAVRRGLILEELGRAQSDAEMRSEMFICGVFSLLDKLLQQPFADLLKSVPVPERVRQTLLADEPSDGPFGPYLELVRAIESESVFDIRDWTERLLLGPGEVNRALLAALRQAQQLEG